MTEDNVINENKQSSHDELPFEDGLDELDLAIAELTGEDNIVKPIRLQNDESFAKIFGGEGSSSVEQVNEKPCETNSLAEKEFDSSDEEDVKNFLEQKYNQYGKDLNKNIKMKKAEQRDAEINREVNNHINKKNKLFNKNVGRVSKLESPAAVAAIRKLPLTGSYKPLNDVNLNNVRSFRPLQRKVNNDSQPINSNLQLKVDNNIYRDPIFGMRLINPLVASSVLVERMEGKKGVSMAGLEFHIERGDLSQDWVIAGVIISKSLKKETQKGDSYSIWKISDLKGDIKVVSLFLFRTAYSALRKTPVGNVIAILNPKVLDKRNDRSDIATLCIDKENQVMILGKSKDFGICKAKKKNGENCSAVVNLNDSDFCIYHVKQEYSKMSTRAELQSSTAGRGLAELRNKVLGKSEVFYGGQSFVAVPAKKSAKLTAKDQKRIMSLSEYYHNPNSANINHTSKEKGSVANIPYAKKTGIKSKLAGNVEVNMHQRLKDLERLKLLKEEDNKRMQILNSETVSSSNDVTQQILSIQNPISKLNILQSSRISSLLNKTPTLNKDSFCVDLNFGAPKLDAAKLKAVKLLKNKPIQKSNPNFVKHRGTLQGKKRAIDELNEAHNDPEAKRKKLEEEIKENEAKTRIQKIMRATSSHANLVNLRELEEQEKYFNKLEKKEKLEEKMLNTYKINCKAVTCLTCKYTSFSASDRCKEQRHPLKVIDAEKRFFECQDCSNRTISLDKMPKQSCNNCKSSRWKRAAMIKERKLLPPGADLSIRGDEEQFVGSLGTKTNLNLLVPAEE